MNKLSVAIIAKNEEVMVREMLESVKNADEIIFVDTGSEDKTIETAKGFKNVKVFTDYKWNDNFSEARNYSIEKCSHEWILVIDCDEILLRHGIKKIMNLINTKWIKKHDGIGIEVKTELEEINSIRVFRNKPEIRYKDAAHNRLEYFQYNPLKAYRSGVKIDSRTSPAHELDKDRTLRILNKALDKEPMNDRYLYYLAREWVNRKEPIKIIYYLNRYVAINEKKQWSNEYADSLYLLALAHTDLKDLLSAINYAIQAIKVLPTFRAPYVFLEAAYKAAGNPSASALFGKFKNLVNNEGVMFIRK